VFSPLGWPFVSKSSVVGEVFPEGGVVVRRIVPLQREAEGCAAGAVCKKLVENTLEPPAMGKLPCPQGRTGAGISMGSCRNQRQQIEKAQPKFRCAFFLDVYGN
jgi:hypothetical protein